MAIKFDKYKTAIILLKDTRINPSIKVNAQGTPLFFVCSKGYDSRYNHDIVEFTKALLKDERVLPELDDIELFKIAIEQGYTEIVKLITEEKDIDTKKLN
jgi:hypothetical protein